MRRGRLGGWVDGWMDGWMLLVIYCLWYEVVAGWKLIQAGCKGWKEGKRAGFVGVRPVSPDVSAMALEGFCFLWNFFKKGEGFSLGFG